MRYKVQEHQVGTTWKDAVVDYSKKGWDNCTFDTKREAEVYAYLWCNSVTRNIAEERAPIMEIRKPKGFRSSATYGEEILMRIVEDE